MVSKKNYNLPFWIITISFLCGILLASFIEIPNVFVIVFSCIGSIVLYFLKPKKALFFIGFSTLIFISLGVIRYNISLPKNQLRHFSKTLKPEHNKAIFRINEVFKNSDKYQNLKVEIITINGVKASGFALIKVKKKDLFFFKGQVYTTALKFYKIAHTAYPYKFDYNKYLLNNDISYWAIVNYKNLVSVNSNSDFTYRINEISHLLQKNLSNLPLSTKVIQLTKALVFGNKSSLDRNLQVNFSKAGVIHILAISGLHIGILYLFFSTIIGQFLYLYKYRWIKTCVVITILWLFVWFTGSSPSSLRAVTMFTCFEIARLLQRKQHGINALLITVLLLLIGNPKILLSVGFQLSVVAVASIIIGVPKLLKLWAPKNKVLFILWQITAVTFCAQIGLLPLSIFYFHQIPTLFLIANIPVMLIIPTLMIFAIALVITTAFIDLPLWIIQFYNFVFKLLIGFVEWIAGLDFFVIKNIYIGFVGLLIGYILFIYWRFYYSFPVRAKKQLFNFSMALIFLFFVGKYQHSWKNETWILNSQATTIVNISNKELVGYSSNDIDFNTKNYLLKPTLLELGIKNEIYKELKNFYKIGQKNLLIIKDNYIPKVSNNPNLILLANSPKINVERLLELYKPEGIIFARNNYSFLIKKWTNTCTKKQVSFFDISKNGSFKFSDL